MDLKDESRVGDMVLEDHSDHVADTKNGTEDDRRDMVRLGKTQELQRNFRFTSIFGFSMILQSSWEAILLLIGLGLENGGTAGIIWIYFITWIGFSFINVSMAEMGSMAPTIGGQYHWVSEFAPRKHQKILSYLMGWLCVLGWQANCAATAYISGTNIQGLITLNDGDYVPQNWQGTLLAIAVATFSVFFNTVLAKKLPLVEGIVLVIHIFAFIGILVTLWVLAPLADAKTVFTQFSDGGGWNSLGASSLVGITGAIAPLLGADASVHMSEELVDAGRALPMSMIITTIANGAMGWVMAITFCFCIGNVSEVLNTPTGYPYMQVFMNTTKSTSVASFLSAIVIWSCIFSNLATVATASRQLYAFARDKAVPFHAWFAQVNKRWDVPLNAITVTFVLSALLSLINIGSPTTLNSITSLATGALMSSYLTSISCMVWRRCTNSPLLPCKFALGRWGLFINIVSVLFIIVFFIFSFFPSTVDPTPAAMNWSSVIWGGVVLLSLGYYYYRGRHEYVGPVEYVRKLD